MPPLAKLASVIFLALKQDSCVLHASVRQCQECLYLRVLCRSRLCARMLGVFPWSLMRLRLDMGGGLVGKQMFRAVDDILARLGYAVKLTPNHYRLSFRSRRQSFTRFSDVTTIIVNHYRSAKPSNRSILKTFPDGLLDGLE